ncbi:MAG: argininosuccinate lyase [Victivallales bacterium]|nr:argininosuccinate lyase [Victivallales bacterium]
MSLWSGRFSGVTAEAVKAFTESISFDSRLFRHDIMGSKAHVQMLAETGIIPAKCAKAINAGLDKIEKRIEKGDFTFSNGLEDIHMHIEDALIEAIGKDAGMIHSGRSRNDQVVLDMRLYLRDTIDSIMSGIKELQRQMVRLADANSDAVMPGYTHLQRAQPVLFAHHLLAYIEMFERDVGRFLDCRKRTNVMPLGSGALAGSTLPLDRKITARLLGFPQVSRNSMDAVADRDFECEFLAASAIFAMHISRLSEDIILWVSQEFNFISIDDAFCTGSSLMPHKKNPDIAELARGKTARIYGDLTSLLVLTKGLPLTYNRDLQEDKEPVFDAADTIHKILSVMPEMIASFKINRTAMEKAVQDPAMMTTDLAEQLVKEGMPFRTAHHRVGSLVKWCDKNSRKLDKISLEEMRISIPEAKMHHLQIFCPLASVSKRTATGATAPAQVKKQIRFWKKKLLCPSQRQFGV